MPEATRRSRIILAGGSGFLGASLVPDLLLQGHDIVVLTRGYRRRGWPIGSGVVESGVKQFNKRVKGSDPFWNEPTLEPILALRGLWLSQDQRWDNYWSNRTAYQAAA
jgi:hypothetical protein